MYKLALATHQKCKRTVSAGKGFRASLRLPEQVTRRRSRACLSALRGAQNWPPCRAGRPGLWRRAASADTSADPLVFWLLVGQISCSAAVVPALTQHPVSTLSSWPYRPPCVDSITNTSAGQQIKWGSAHARPQSSTRIHNWACKLSMRLCVSVPLVQGSNCRRS